MLDPPGSTGVSEWMSVTQGRAQNINNKLRKIIANDFDDGNSVETDLGPNGTVTYDLAISGGVANVQSGIGVSHAMVKQAGGIPLVGATNAEGWYVESKCKITIAAGNPETFYECVGLQDPITLQSAFFGVIGSSSQTLLAVGLFGTANDVFLTNVPVDIVAVSDPGGWHQYSLAYDIDNAMVVALYDGARVLEVTNLTNLMAGRALFFSYAHQTLAGGPSRQILVDRLATVVEGAL